MVRGFAPPYSIKAARSIAAGVITLKAFQSSLKYSGWECTASAATPVSQVCPQHGLSVQPEGIHRDRELCTACGTCVDACPSNAMEMLGKKITPDDLVDELLKDRAYFEKSGGGVTLSGGEPTLQPAFTLELLMQLKLQGIQTALDTCGLCSRETLADLLPWVDVLLFDLKLADSSSAQSMDRRRQRTHSGQPEMGLRSGRRGFPFAPVMGQNTLDPRGNLYA